MLWWTLQNLAVCTALAAAIALACRCRRPGPVVRHALWLVVLLKLLTPPLIAWPWALHPPLASLPQRKPEATPAPPQPRPLPELIQIAPSQTGTVSVPFASPPRPTVASSAELSLPAPRRRNWPSLLLRAAAIGWIIGSVVFAAIESLRIVRILQRLRRALPPAPSLQRCVDALSTRLRLRQPIRTRIVPGLASPLIFSLARPQLLWPADLLPSLAGDAQHGLILHELAHVKRGDHRIGWLELLAGCLWWWNPLFWYVRHQLRENAELAADAWVVQTLPPGRARRAYAESLLAVCENLCVPQRLPRRIDTPMPAVGINTGGRQFLERRLSMIFRDQIPALHLGRAGWLTLLLMMLAALPAWSQKSPPATEAPAQAGDLPASRTLASYLAVSFTTAATGDAALPAGAQELIDQYQAQADRARQEYEKKIAEQRALLIDGLQKLQDKYTKAGQLDEAVAVRDRIRQMQRESTVATVPLQRTSVSPPQPNPGDLQAYRDRVNQSFDFQVTGYTRGDVWGSSIYTDDSSLAAAAVHAGVLKDGESGVVRVTILPGQPSYTGSARNGVTTADYGPWPGSFRFEPPLHAYRPTAIPRGNGLEEFRSKPGISVLREITGSTQGTVWGTDVYTDDSSLEAAAVHAGVLHDGQKGTVKITILPGRDSYQGTPRNGVTSQDYASWPGSFRIESAAGVKTTEPESSGETIRRY